MKRLFGIFAFSIAFIILSVYVEKVGYGVAFFFILFVIPFVLAALIYILYLFKKN